MQLEKITTQESGSERKAIEPRKTKYKLKLSTKIKKFAYNEQKRDFWIQKNAESKLSDYVQLEQHIRVHSKRCHLRSLQKENFITESSSPSWR